MTNTAKMSTKKIVAKGLNMVFKDLKQSQLSHAKKKYITQNGTLYIIHAIVAIVS